MSISSDSDSGGAMGRPHILQKNGQLKTEIAILNLEIFILLVEMENGRYHGLPIPITALELYTLNQFLYLFKVLYLIIYVKCKYSKPIGWFQVT